MEMQQGEEAVIGQGLTVGEEVVTDGQLRLSPGAQVTTPGSREGRPAPTTTPQGGSSREGTDPAAQPGGRGPGTH